MSRNSPTVASRPSYQSIFDSALVAYKKKTGKDLASDPLLRRLESCESPDAILNILREQMPASDQSQAGSSDTKWAEWLNPTVKVLYTYSMAIGGSVGQVSLSRFETVMAPCRLRSDICLSGIPPCRDNIHGNWCLTLGKHLPRSLSISHY